MSCGAGRHGVPLGIHHQNPPKCLQVDEVPITVSIAYFGANFSGDLDQVKDHTEEASYNAVLAVCHGYVTDLLYQICVHQLHVCISALPSINEAFQVLLFLTGS